MAIFREKTDLDKKPTWFLFLGANVLVLLGCAITWILIAKYDSVNQSLLWLPTLICNLLSLGLAGLFLFFEGRDIAPKIMHFNKKWLRFYIVGFAFFVASILFNVLFYLFVIREPAATDPQKLINDKWQLAVYFALTGLLTLLAIGFQRYARFRIDLDVYKRKHGEMVKQAEEEKAKAEAVAKVQEPKVVTKKPVKKTTKKKSPTKPTGGLLDQMDK